MKKFQTYRPNMAIKAVLWKISFEVNVTLTFELHIWVLSMTNFLDVTQVILRNFKTHFKVWNYEQVNKHLNDILLCFLDNLRKVSNLNRLEGVAEKSLLPSGDQTTRDTPPPPSLHIGVHVSKGTTQDIMEVLTGDDDIRIRPSGLHDKLVTGLWPVSCRTCTELDNGLKYKITK